MRLGDEAELSSRRQRLGRHRLAPGDQHRSGGIAHLEREPGHADVAAGHVAQSATNRHVARREALGRHAGEDEADDIHRQAGGGVNRGGSRHHAHHALASDDQRCQTQACQDRPGGGQTPTRDGQTVRGRRRLVETRDRPRTDGGDREIVPRGALVPAGIATRAHQRAAAIAEFGAAHVVGSGAAGTVYEHGKPWTVGLGHIRPLCLRPR